MTEEIRKKGACRALIAIPIELETAATQYAIEQFDVASRKDVVGFSSCGGSDDGGIFALWPCFTYFGQANNRSLGLTAMGVLLQKTNTPLAASLNLQDALTTVFIVNDGHVAVREVPRASMIIEARPPMLQRTRRRSKVQGRNFTQFSQHRVRREITIGVGHRFTTVAGHGIKNIHCQPLRRPSVLRR